MQLSSISLALTRLAQNQGGSDPHPGSNLLMEDGFNLLLENGSDALLLE